MLTLEQQNYAYNAYVETIKEMKKPKSLWYPKFNSYCSMYVGTTENLADYIKKLKIAGKDVLTVTGSGDQLINLALLGAKKVDNFDINRNAYFMTQLKMAALQALSYEEYLDFFCSAEDKEIKFAGIAPTNQKVGENPNVFDFKTYLKIKPYLSEDSAFFWNLIYEEFQYDGHALANSHLLYYATKNDMRETNLYLKNEEEYNKAREAILNVEIGFMECNLLDVHTLPNTYDVMLFSNIYKYLIDEWYAVISEDAFVDYIQDKAATRLNPKGVIAVGYQYNYKTKNYTNKSLISKILGTNYTIEREKCFSSMKKIVVPSTVKEYRKENNKDCVYIYEKGKTK